MRPTQSPSSSSVLGLIGFLGVKPRETSLGMSERNNTKEFLNVRETAQQLAVHENTVRNWEARGVLKGIKLPGSGFRRFPREEIERMRHEMLKTYAPATELPKETRTGVKGTVVILGPKLPLGS